MKKIYMLMSILILFSFPFSTVSAEEFEYQITVDVIEETVGIEIVRDTNSADHYKGPVNISYVDDGYYKKVLQDKFIIRNTGSVDVSLQSKASNLVGLSGIGSNLNNIGANEIAIALETGFTSWVGSTNKDLFVLRAGEETSLRMSAYLGPGSSSGSFSFNLSFNGVKY